MKKVKIQYMSDLHLEFPENYKHFVNNNAIKPVGDILVIAGDLHYLQNVNSSINYSSPILDYLKKLKDSFKRIYVVPGNHEYYGGDVTILETSGMKKEIIPGVIFLNNYWDQILVNNQKILIIGGTMWTNPHPLNYKKVLNSMNDYKNILWKRDQRFIPGLASHEHARFLDTLVGRMSIYKNDNDVKKIVISHHCPFFKGMKNWYHCSDIDTENPKNNSKEIMSLVDAYCANSLQEVVDLARPDLWIYGHTHASNKFLNKGENNNNLLIVENSMGYVGRSSQNTNFNPEAYIEI